MFFCDLKHDYTFSWKNILELIGCFYNIFFIKIESLFKYFAVLKFDEAVWNLHIYPSIHCLITSRIVIIQFLQLYHKMSLIKVVWYVLKVKNIHCWSSLDPWGPWGKDISSYIHNFIWQGRVKLRILKLASGFHHTPFWSQVVVCIGTPRIYPLVMFYSKLVCNWFFNICSVHT